MKIYEDYSLSNLPNEFWRPIPGFYGYYMASSLGRIKSVNRYIYTKSNRLMHYTSRIIHQRKSSQGYLHVTLHRNNKRIDKRVNRLVAKTFCANSHKYPIVNHKDMDTLNNRASNLEWCTYIHNNNWKNRNKKLSHSLSRSIILYKSGKSYKFYSINRAVEWLRQLGYKHTNKSQLSMVAGDTLQIATRKMAGGYIKYYPTIHKIVHGFHAKYV